MPRRRSRAPSSLRREGLEAAVTTGHKVKVSGKAANRKGRKAGTATLTYSLRSKKSAKSGKRLGTSKVKKTKGGKSRKFSKTLTIPAATKAGTTTSSPARRKKACCKQEAGGQRQAARDARPPGRQATTAPRASCGDAITAAGMLEHLKALQHIADDNGGNRASGFQGYGGSVEYVMGQLPPRATARPRRCSTSSPSRSPGPGARAHGADREDVQRRRSSRR